MQDPRWAQIAVLCALAAWGEFGLDFGIGWERALAILATGQLVQALGNAARGERFEPRSALISSLSLILLLRSSHIGWSIAGTALAVGSKFVLRYRGRHLFNPTNLALVVLLLVTDAVWVSTGQWGQGAIIAASLAAAALWVLPRVRGDVTLAFAAIWAALHFGRALWLGDPLAIPLHQLSSGALFVFAAFMLSDPRTIPNARAGRISFALLVAAGGYVGRFVYYEPNALFYSLAAWTLCVPFIDVWFPGGEFRWPGTQTSSTQTQETARESRHPQHTKPIDWSVPASPPVGLDASAPGGGAR